MLGIGIVYRADKPTAKNLEIRNSQFKAEVVSTDVTRGKGLSGRDALNKDAVMVFEYNELRELCFWMKDMRFAIDIVWLDTEKRVTSVERNVTPESYPKNYCHQGQYVLEFKAGTARDRGLMSGDKAQF